MKIRCYTTIFKFILAIIALLALDENAIALKKLSKEPQSEFIKIAERDKDNFYLSYRFKVITIGLPVWISPHEYALYYYHLLLLQKPPLLSRLLKISRRWKLSYSSPASNAFYQH